MIVFLITSTLHNNMILLRKNHDNRRMLYIAREIIEDKRNHIKNSNNIEAYKTILAQNTSSVSGAIEMPSESLKMALTVIVTGPIILVYPFIQKYFVSGVTIGAVKG